MRPFHFITACAFLLLPALFSLLSCAREENSNAAVHVREEDPLMSAQNIDVLFSDMGSVQARLTSPLMNRYGGEDPYLEFPKGFRILMYDSLKRVSTTITGDRGIRRENMLVMEAWGNVVVRNELKNEQMNTEHLVWEERKHLIRSDVKVKITRTDQVLYGSSMESNEAFTRYSIKDPVGEMTVKKDSI